MLKLASYFHATAERKQPPLPAITILPMLSTYVESVARIDRDGHARPWSEGRFHRAKADRDRGGVVALLAGTARVVGYAVVAIDRPAATLRVLRFGVDKDLRRRRIAARVFDTIADDCALDGLTTIEVPVPEQLSEPRKFLVSQGFQGSHVVRGYFGSEDAWVFTKKIECVCQGK